MWIEPEPQHCKVHYAYCIREAAKKVLLLMTGPLIGGV